MTKFISRSAKWILILSGYFLLVWLLNNYFFHEVNKVEYNDKRTLVLGDSRMLCFNESIFENSINLSEQAQPYNVAYYQLKFYDKLNNIDHLVLSYSYINLSQVIEDFLRNDYQVTKRMYHLTNPISLYHHTLVKKNWLKVTAKYFMTINVEYFFKYLKYCIFKMSPNDRTDLVQFQSLEKLKEIKSDYCNQSDSLRLSKIDNAIKYIFEGEKSDFETRLSIKYVKAIANYCQENKIKLHLVNMPFDPNFRKKIPKEDLLFFQKLTEELVTKYGANYYNYEDYGDMNFDAFTDAVHCTPYCASLITQELFDKVIINSPDTLKTNGVD